MSGFPSIGSLLFEAKDRVRTSFATLGLGSPPMLPILDSTIVRTVKVELISEIALHPALIVLVIYLRPLRLTAVQSSVP